MKEWIISLSKLNPDKGSSKNLQIKAARPSAMPWTECSQDCSDFQTVRQTLLSGNGERGTGNWELGTENGELGTENWELGTGNEGTTRPARHCTPSLAHQPHKTATAALAPPVVPATAVAPAPAVHIVGCRQSPNRQPGEYVLCHETVLDKFDQAREHTNLASHWSMSISIVLISYINTQASLC